MEASRAQAPDRRRRRRRPAATTGHSQGGRRGPQFSGMPAAALECHESRGAGPDRAPPCQPNLPTDLPTLFSSTPHHIHNLTRVAPNAGDVGAAGAGASPQGISSPLELRLRCIEGRDRLARPTCGRPGGPRRLPPSHAIQLTRRPCWPRIYICISLLSVWGGRAGGAARTARAAPGLRPLSPRPHPLVVFSPPPQHNAALAAGGSLLHGLGSNGTAICFNSLHIK